MTVKHCGFPAVKVEAALADGPGTLPGDATWVDLTDRTLGFDVRRGRGSQFDQPQPGQATIRFNNDDGYLSAAASWDSLVAADDPVGWWKFNEASGNFADSSGNGYTLTASAGGTIDYQEAGHVSNYAVDLNTTGQADRTYTAGLNPAAITVEAWVQPTSLPGALHTVWSSDMPSPPRGYLCQFDANGHIYAGAWNGVGIGYVEGPDGTVVAGEWVYVAWTNDGTTGTLYVNGVEVAQGSQPYVAATSGSFYVGDDSTNTHNFRGVVDEVAVYNYVLSAGRIRAHASGIAVPVGAQVRITTSHYRARVHADEPVGHWLLDETSGTSAVDDSGNGRSGTHTSVTAGQTSLVALESGGDGHQPYPRRSVLYNGTSSYTEVAHHADWVPDSGGWTLHLLCLFATVGAGTARNLISKSDASSTDWWLGVNTSNQLFFRYVDVGGTNRDLTVSWTPTLSTTYHLAVTFDGTYVRIYVDGVVVATSADMSANVPRSGSGRPLRFARHQAAYGFNGRLDEVAVIQSCLTAENLADLAAMALEGTALFHGYAEQWPNRWELQKVGMSTVTAYDGLAQLARRTLALGDWRDWTMAYRPSAYFRLDDPEGTAVAADETGRYRAPVSHDSAGLTDDGIVWEFEPPAVGDGTGAVFVGALLEPARAALPSGLDEFTVETWMHVAGGTSTERYVLIAEDANASNVDVVLSVETVVDTESMTVTGRTSAGNDVDWVGSPTSAGTNGWVHILFSRHVAGSTETLILYVNGATLLSDFPDYTVEDLDSERLFIGSDQNLVGNSLHNDILDEFAIYPYALQPPTIGERRGDQTASYALHRAEWGLGRWRGDLASERIGRILDLARWPDDAGARPLSVTAVDRMPLSEPGSQSALAHCQDAARTNGSLFYVDGAGTFVLADNDTAPRWTFADDGTGLSYQDLTIANDDQYTFTAAEVRDGDGKEFTAVDDTAAGLFGLNTHTASLTTTSANVAQAYADWHVYRYAWPRIRISQLEVSNPTSAAAGVCMTLQPGHQVQIQRTDGDNVLDDPVYVDEVAHTWDASTRAVATTMQLSPAGPDTDVFRLDESLLDSGDILAYA